MDAVTAGLVNIGGDSIGTISDILSARSAEIAATAQTNE